MSQSGDSPAPLLKRMSYLLLALGVLFRIAPLFNAGRRVFHQFPSEDGYLMLTIARNIAEGNGMSTAMGELPTNGTQPLFTLIQSGIFWLVGNDRFWGVLIVQVVEIAIAVATAYLLYSLILNCLDKSRSQWKDIAFLAGSLWFGSGVMIVHTMNCLETGLTMMLIMLSMNMWVQFSRRRGERSMVDALKLGVALGLTFLARIDAVFTIAALTIVHALAPWYKEERGRRLVESTVMGLTSIVVGSPWLIFNYLSFGSIMPISGTAQADNAVFGVNLREVPFKIVENGTLLFPIPASIEATTVGLIAACIATAVYIGICVMLWKKTSGSEREALAPAVVLLALLVGYYGFYFGASYFVSRYLAAVSLWGALVTAVVVLFVASKVQEKFGSAGVMAALVFPIVFLVVGLNYRWYKNGHQHQHSQVVDWVKHNVPENAWIGAPQTGTLGFFHDRTVNLDGKVNPQALEARLAGTTTEYLLDSRFGPEQSRIEYIVDWEGVGEWVKLPEYSPHFELLIHDKPNNLGALGRLGRPAVASKN